MKLIVGLGNPGKKYEKNRHNVGFVVCDAFAIDNGLGFKKSLDLMCYFAKTADFLLIEPTTFMNDSGESVLAVANFYKIPAGNLLVIHDDLDIPFGKIRLATDGSSGGHKGVESVIKRLSTPDFNRLRVGVDHPIHGQSQPKVEDYVLSNFTPEEQQSIDKVVKKCNEAIVSYLHEGIEATMNKYN